MSQNLILPGNPRYQPKELFPVFGYDRLYVPLGEVEVATFRTLGELGVITQEEVQQLSTTVIDALLEIPTTDVDEIERTITRHDVRAWIICARAILEARGLGHLGRWLHVPLTSYDPIHTARTLQYTRAWNQALKPACKEVIELFCEMTERFAGTLQVGRTHGQHALPVTVGFWIATILDRLVYNVREANSKAQQLVGKISGAVGAYNAQVGLGFASRCGEKSFERRVLAKLGLEPAWISTQILPPEPLAYFLHAVCMISAALGQFGRDCRHLMRSEIAEIGEPFAEGQVGSSTMAHKRNPINFENTEGMWLRTKNEFGKVMDTLISEHQRDLVGSSVERDFPIILINVQQQLNTLRRRDKKTETPFLRRIQVDEASCRRNFEMSAYLLLSEPLYIALSMAGYSVPGKDGAHELVNQTLTPRAQKSGRLLIEECIELAESDEAVEKALGAIPADLIQLLHHPEQYTGLAREKALESAKYIRQAISVL